MSSDLSSEPDKIEDLQSDIMAHRTDKRRVKKNITEIEKLSARVRDEMLKARGIVGVERRGKPRPCYFNSGCGLYRDGITTLEIESDVIRLVKWHKKPKDGQDFEVYDDGAGQTLSDFVRQVVA